MKPSSSEITLIGNDPSLAYLINRFADQCGYYVIVHTVIPSAEGICARKPALVLFSSVEYLASAQNLVGTLAESETPVGVCTSASDEARARQLGAEHCLLHPLTYDGFMKAILLGSPPGSTKKSRSTPDRSGG